MGPSDKPPGASLSAPHPLSHILSYTNEKWRNGVDRKGCKRGGSPKNRQRAGKRAPQANVITMTTETGLLPTTYQTRGLEGGACPYDRCRQTPNPTDEGFSGPSVPRAQSSLGLKDSKRGEELNLNPALPPTFSATLVQGLGVSPGEGSTWPVSEGRNKKRDSTASTQYWSRRVLRAQWLFHRERTEARGSPRWPQLSHTHPSPLICKSTPSQCVSGNRMRRERGSHVPGDERSPD